MTSRPLRVFCTDTAWERYGAALREAAPGIEPILLVGDEQVTDEDLGRIEVAFFSADAYPSRAAPFMGACLRAPSLRWLHTFSAGTDNPVFTMFLDRGVRLTNSSGSSAQPIAQTVAMMILALSRDLPGWLRAQSESRWAPRSYDDVTGARLGVVGMGPIGREVARLGQALGMDVVGCRRTPSGDEPCETWPLDRLPELAASVDWLVLALPLTPDTRGIVGVDVLAAMQPTARLVNVGRGELVDEPALVDALQHGRLAGAGLDVFAVEPLPADSPLWAMPNVIITPHSSGSTASSHHQAALRFVDNLGRFARGDGLLGEITRSPQ